MNHFPHHRLPMRLSLITLCLGLAAPVWAQSTAAAFVPVTVSIPAQPLDKALTALAAQTGMLIGADSSLLAGKQAPALSGTYTPADALHRLLAGSGLEAVAGSDGSVQLRKAAVQEKTENTLPAVTVNVAVLNEGTAEQGYRSDKVSQVGPWQGRTLQDTPYSITVISKELIENLQATTPDQIYRIAPTVEFRRPQSENDQPGVNIRGLGSGTYRDGLPGDQYGHGTTTEDVESVEIFSGLSGFLYGPGNVGGMINYVSKRPTAERLNRVTLGNNGGSNYYIHGDFGGPLDEAGRFGYRINGVWQGGDTATKHQDIRKQFISGAFDWHVTDKLLLQFDAAYRNYEIYGGQATWGLAPGVTRPSAKDIDRSVSWGQDWAYRYYETQRYGTRLRWEASDVFTLRAAWEYNNSKRNWGFSSNTIQADGTYNQMVFGLFAPGENSLLSEQFDHRGQVFGDLSFQTGAVEHKLTTGMQYRKSVQERFANYSPNFNYSGLTLDRPTYFDKPTQVSVDRGPLNKVTDYSYTSLLIGDDITLNDHWSMLVGVARSTIDVKPSENWGTPGYKKSAVTPNLSLIYKPVETITTYASYIEALEQGGAAGDEYNGQPVANAGQVMEPMISKQVEVGVKASVGGMLLTSALFQIDRSLQYYDVTNPSAPVYVQDGRQAHRGIEFTAFGKVTRNLTLAGGLTFLDAKIKEQKQTPALEGKQPAGVAEQLVKLRAEYQVPGLPALSLSGTASYNSSSYVDAMNTDRLSGYTIYDLGARYQLDMAGQPLTLRLDINNLTDKAYWSQNGSLGIPRTVLFSLSTKF